MIAVVSIFHSADFYHRHFFDTGSGVIVYNLTRLLFALLFSWMVYSLGHLILSTVTVPAYFKDIRPLEHAVFGFGTGLGALHLIMLVLGVGGLYHGRVMLALSLILLGAGGLHFGELARTLVTRRFQVPPPMVIVGIAVIGISAIWLVAVKGIYPGGGGDYYTHYFYYYLAVLHNHGLAPNDVWYHYYYSKGAGPTFLSMLLTDPEAPELVTYCCVIFAAVGIATLSARLVPHSLWPALAAALYLLAYIVPLGPADGGEFQKPHEETSALVVLVAWALCMRRIGPISWRRACIVMASAALVGAAILEVAAAIILSVVMVTFAVFSIVRRKRVDAIDYGLLAALGGSAAILILCLNYAVTGLATDQALDFMLKFADLERLNAWGVVPQIIIVAWIRDNYAITAPHLGLASFATLRDYLRLDYLWTLIVSASLALSLWALHPLPREANAPRQWRLTSSELIVGALVLLAIGSFAFSIEQTVLGVFDSLPWALPALSLVGFFLISARTVGSRKSLALRPVGEAARVAMFLGGFLGVLALISVPAAGSQTVSYLRFCGFFVPLIILLVVACWGTWIANLRFNRVPPFVAAGIPCILFCAALGTWQISNVWFPRAFAQTKHAARFAFGRYSLADAYSHQSAGLPYGGIKPAVLAAMRRVPPGSRIWSTDVDSYCMVPGCVIESSVSFKMSPRLNDIVNGPPQDAQRILQSEGLNYFIFALDAPNGIIDLLPFSRLFAPQTIGRHLGVKWTNGQVYLLTWRGPGIVPMDSRLLQVYAARLAAAEHPWFRFRKLLPQMNATIERLRRSPHPWHTLIFTWRTPRGKH